MGVLASTGIVISAAYSIYMYNRVCFGLFSKYTLFCRDINRREFYAIVPLIILIFILGIYPSVVIDMVKTTVILQEAAIY